MKENDVHKRYEGSEGVSSDKSLEIRADKLRRRRTGSSLSHENKHLFDKKRVHLQRTNTGE